MIAAKRAVSEGEKAAKAKDSSATTGGNSSGTKTPGGVAGDKGRGSEGEEFKEKEKGSSSEGGEGGEGGGGEEEEEEEWEQVGPKNKSTITRQVCVCICTYACILDSYFLQDDMYTFELVTIGWAE